MIRSKKAIVEVGEVLIELNYVQVPSLNNYFYPSCSFCKNVREQKGIYCSKTFVLNARTGYPASEVRKKLRAEAEKKLQAEFILNK